jgi:alpha-ribazole phosphatase
VQLFLIRHPRPLLAAGICYGQLDVEAEDPQPIAERLRPLLPADTPVIASPLQRARDLAEALHPQARYDRRLLEIDFGAWEGQPWDQIDRRLLDAWAADVLHFAPPGGESAAALQARVVDCVRGLRGDSVALVTHAGSIRALLGYWLQLPIGDWSRLPLAFGSITLLEIDATGGERPRQWQGQPRTPGVLRYLNR